MRHLVASLARRNVNYARRQQYRRLLRAGESAVGAAVTTILGLEVATLGARFLAVGLLLTAIALGVYARHCLALARRSPGRSSVRGCSPARARAA